MEHLEGTLPDGLTERPLTSSDASAVYEVMAAEQRADLGTVEIELADIVGDWQRPSFDVSASTWGIFDGDRLVGYAEHSGGDRADASVHPAYTGRGLGTRLARFMQAKARERGATVVGMPVPSGGRADRLLAALGYRVRWTSWELRLPSDARVSSRELPAGFSIGAAASEEWPEVHGVLEDAFLEWSERERESYADFTARTTRRPGFAPWMLRRVTDDAGRVAAVASMSVTESGELYVDRLATRSDARGRGLAQSLLVDAVTVGRAHGAGPLTLSTDSRTGALGLYEKVGMVVGQTWVNRGIDL